MIFTGSPLSGRNTSLPSRAKISALSVTVNSVMTCQKSQVSETIDMMPAG